MNTEGGYMEKIVVVLVLAMAHTSVSCCVSGIRTSVCGSFVLAS